MKRYTVESFDPYDMEEAPDGMWVMHDDAEAAIAAAAAAARAQALEEAAQVVDAAQPMGRIAATAAAIRDLK